MRHAVTSFRGEILYESPNPVKKRRQEPFVGLQGGRLQGLARGQARNHFFAKMNRPG